MRIVLVDPLGDVLFSGESMVAATAQPFPAPAMNDDEEEPCPQTRRSAESGVFPALRRPANREPIVMEPTPISEPAPQVATAKASERAA